MCARRDGEPKPDGERVSRGEPFTDARADDRAATTDVSEPLRERRARLRGDLALAVAAKRLHVARDDHARRNDDRE